MDNENSKIKVAVLSGGIGHERAVSVESGKCISKALAEAGFNVVTSDIRPDYMDILDDSSIDCFFLALHGEFGEDGKLQQILEDKSLVYTGSGPEASRLAFDKMAAKRKFSQASVTTPRGIEFENNTNIAEFEKSLRKFGNKFVVKPTRQGSSVGIAIVEGVEDAIAACKKCLADYGNCMAEEFIKGRELTVGVLFGRALPIIEIKPKREFYNYQAKYVDDDTEFLFDTIGSAALKSKIEAAAINCFNALGCRHFSRIDFLLDERNQQAYVLEVNTIPGFTSHSLLPMAAAKAGIKISALCEKIVRTTIESCKFNTVD